MSKTARSFARRKTAWPGAALSPGGPDCWQLSPTWRSRKAQADENPRKLLRSFPSKCKWLTQCFAKRGRKSPSHRVTHSRLIVQAVGEKNFRKSSNKSALNTSTVRKFLSLGLNAIHTKGLLLTSHLQSPPGHRQDHFNNPGSETPIVPNLQPATGYQHCLLLCKRKDLEGEGWALWKLWTEEGKKLPLTQCCQRACVKNKVNGFPFL